MQTSPRNTRTNRWLGHQTRLTISRALALVLLAFVAFAVSPLNPFERPSHPAAQAVQHVPTPAEIARAVNGSATFQRPSAMEYVPKTNSCIVGGTVTSASWHVGTKDVSVDSVDSNSVDYTSFTFTADDGQVFTVSDNDALFMDPGENLGLELWCDRATMTTAKSFGMIAIIWGGK